jgi:outer membrane protein assembly factor BamB
MITNPPNSRPRRGHPLLIVCCAATLFGLPLSPLHAGQWQMAGRDPGHTNRADFEVPAGRQNDSFFDRVRWQTPSPGSPGQGGFSSSTMVFFDSAGPGGSDIVVSGYHWPKGVQGMDRHSGARHWFGLPSGGEAIGARAPAFSNDGSVVYVTNDATPNPLMAFATTAGPAVYRDNGEMADPGRLGMSSPTIDASGRIFLHPWNNRPYAGLDDGLAIREVWSADTHVNACIGDPSLHQGDGATTVVIGGRHGQVVAYHGAGEQQLWRVETGAMIDATITVDPANGNLYVGAGLSDVHVIGLAIDGSALWETPAVRVHQWIDGVNNPERTAGAGALSHDGDTYYFQSNSQVGEGKLYAINTASGSIKWTLDTGSSGWEMYSAAPIVTPNGVLVIGNNNGGVYYALRDDGDRATVFDTLTVDEGGTARATATLSSDGTLYLPLRTRWTAGNGDGDAPSGETANVYSAFDLTVNVFANGFESSDGG